MAAVSLVELLQTVALAHEAGPVEGPLARAWNVDPALLIPVALAAWFYARGLRRWDERTREHPWWRTFFYASGLALLLVAIESPLDRLAEHHLSMHMVQHVLLMTIAVPLILLGAPTTPTLRGMPRWLRLGVIRPLARRTPVRLAYRWGTHPALAIAAMSAVLWLWHIGPGWYDAALRRPLLHDLQHISLVGTAWLFWWNVIDPKPLRSRLPYIPRLLYIFAASVPQQFLGVMFTFAEHPLYQTYADAAPILALSARDDQVLGGLIMWVPGGMLLLGAMGIVFAIWAYKSEQAQRALEAERARERAAAAAR